jgi:hypothetical protein
MRRHAPNVDAIRWTLSAIKNVRTGAHGSLPAPKGPDDLLRI